MKVFDNMDSKRWIPSVGDYSLGSQRVSFFMKSHSILFRENVPINFAKLSTTISEHHH